MITKDQIKAALFGIAIADAIGVPAEFLEREELRENPITGMTGYSTHNQPAGTYSDDTALTLCLAERIAEGYSVEKLAEKCIKWYKDGYLSARGNVFDIGMGTQDAFERIINGTAPTEAGGSGEYDNGNGALMRILPLVFTIKDLEVEERFKFAQESSSITHRHPISVFACFYFMEFVLGLLNGRTPLMSFRKLLKQLPIYFDELGIKEEHLPHFTDCLKTEISFICRKMK